MGSIAVGVDLGQRRDPTAIAVVEVEIRQRERVFETAPRSDGRVYADRVIDAVAEDHYVVRHLERLSLGTSYPQVAERVAAVTRGAVARSGNWPMLYVDATGVGQPVVDVLRAAGVQAHLKPTYFTHGDRRTEDNGEVKLGKAWIVSYLQALLQGGRLHLPQTAEARALAAELIDYEIRVDENANDRYGAFKVGKHDDLVTAIGLAVQPVRRVNARLIGSGGQEHGNWRPF